MINFASKGLRLEDYERGTSGVNLFKTPVIASYQRIRNPHFVAVQKVESHIAFAAPLPSCLHIAEMLRSGSLIILLVAIAATSADFECPEVEGIFPDPDDCRSFYQGSIYALDDYDSN